MFSKIKFFGALSSDIFVSYSEFFIRNDSCMFMMQGINQDIDEKNIQKSAHSNFFNPKLIFYIS